MLCCKWVVRIPFPYFWKLDLFLENSWLHFVHRTGAPKSWGLTVTGKTWSNNFSSQSNFSNNCWNLRQFGTRIFFKWNFFFFLTFLFNDALSKNEWERYYVFWGFFCVRFGECTEFLISYITWVKQKTKPIKMK